MNDIQKFFDAIKVINADAKCEVRNSIPQNQSEFETNLKWISGADSFGLVIWHDTNPYSEITYAKVKEEYDKL